MQRFISYRLKKSFRLIIVLIVLITLFSFIYKKIDGTAEVISPLADEHQRESNTKSQGNKNKARNADQLLKQINNFLENQTGIFSFYVYDLKRDEGFGINETTIFTAASVNKIPILATLYYQAQKGVIDLDERITVQEKDIQDYGTGVIRYEGAGTVYSIKSLAQLMIEKSDNTAAYILLNMIGEDEIQTLIDSWGLVQTSMKDNKTSNKDMAILFAKIFKGQITNRANTLELLGFMDESDFENRLPALLPKDVKIYHKIGNEVGNIHDVGIVDLPKNPYYIGVMTNDITDDSTAESIIAQISKMTYDYMNSL